MDISGHDFRRNLLSILQHIANASYVTFDLEMSGIRASSRRSRDAGKPSLQQLYDENREAAQTFQVLQVGITCIEENQFYLARPYNFFLSPLTVGKLDFNLDRTFSFSSSACDFLKNCNFDFGKVFSHGVPYLTQQEEREATTEFEQRARANEQIPDLVIPASDAAALKFYRDAKKKIETWIKDENVDKDSWLNVSGDDGPLNGYQRRLMYQLVRKYFPEYRTFSQNNNSFMQVKRIDHDEETRRQDVKRANFDSQIAKQTGLRWIFEALTNGDLNGINPAWFCDPQSEDVQQEFLLKSHELHEVKNKLRDKKHIIIGHNLFTDLIFLYKTFVEELPIRVKHFQKEINHLFPTVFDTKFLASYGLGNMKPNTSLGELLIPFKTVHVPLVLLEQEHTSYNHTRGKEHEAGFDSWMTSELFIKLSSKLYHERKHTLPDPLEDSDPDEPPPHTVSKPSSAISSSPTSTSSTENLSVDTSGGVKLSPSPLFSSTNKFAALIDEEADAPGEYYARQLNNVKSDKRQWLPKMTHSFWHVYMNKLQVNASDKGVCDLSEYAEEGHD